jgi:hypothetical protein
MVAFLTFLQNYEMVAYYLAALAVLWYLYRLLAAQVRLSKAAFGLERELAQGNRNGAAGMLGVIILLTAGIHLAVHYGLPEAKRIERIRMEANAVNVPTVTPSPTPLELFGVDVSGCTNVKARLLEPRPGEAVRGKITLQIVADIPNFAFYNIDLGRPDEPDVWVPLFTSDEIATEEEPFSWTWDSAIVPPGVYHIRLTVMKADLTFPPQCVVPIQVLAEEL